MILRNCRPRLARDSDPFCPRYRAKCLVFFEDFAQFLRKGGA
jgi:hypothetical protein